MANNLTELSPEAVMELRRQVRAWTVKFREYEDATRRALENRHEAVYRARLAGIPTDVVAADADVDRSRISRMLDRHCTTRNLPRPEPVWNQNR